MTDTPYRLRPHVWKRRRTIAATSGHGIAIALVMLVGAGHATAQRPGDDENRRETTPRIPTVGDVRTAQNAGAVTDLLRQRDQHIADNWLLGAHSEESQQAPGSVVYHQANFPEALTTADALRHAAILELDDTAQRAWLEHFASYQQRVIDLQQQRVEPANEAYAELRALNEAGDREAFIIARNAYLEDHLQPVARTLEREEERLYEQLRGMLSSDEQLDAMTWVAFDRDRALRAQRLSTMIRGANIDLIDLAEDIGIALDWRGERGRVARNYLEDLVELQRELSRMQDRIAREEAELMQMRGQLPHADFMQRRAEIRRPQVQGHLRIAHINHSYRTQLANALDDEEAAAALRSAFNAKVYPEIYPDRDRARFEEALAEISRNAELSEAQQDSIEEVQLGLENWYTAIEPQAEEMVFSYHAELAQTMSSQISIMDRYRSELSGYLRERRNRVDSAIEQLREIVGDG